MTTGRTATRLDEVMPHWHYREHHELPVSSPPAAVLSAVEEVTWREVPLFRALMTVRFPGHALLPDAPVFGWFERTGFTVLTRTEQELVVAALKPVTNKAPRAEVGDVGLGVFREFGRPGYIKIAFNFRCAGGILSTETRVLATDSRARRVFAAYWLAIRAGSGIIRHVWLRAIRRRARRAA